MVSDNNRRIAFAVLTAAVAGCGGASEPTPVATALAVGVAAPTSAPAGSALAPSPTVRVNDQKGGGMAGIPVEFSVSEGGSITVASAITGSDGVASPGTWTLANLAGVNTLTAKSGTLTPLTINVLGSAGAATRLVKQAGDEQTAVVNVAVTNSPRVKLEDRLGNAVPNQTVTFTLTGGGTVTSASAQTTTAGTVTPGTWRLGTTAGVQTLTASYGSVPSVSFTATALPGPASVMTKLAGDNQTTDLRGAVGIAPSVKVADQYGNGISNAAVSFLVSAGGGTVTGATPVTNASGVATLGTWTTGPFGGTNTLTVASAGVSSVTFTATAGTAGNACGDRGTLTLGGSASGTLATTDCQISTGRYVDLYNLSVPTSGGVILTQTSSVFPTRLQMFTSAVKELADNSLTYPVPLVPATNTIKAIVNAGSFLAIAGSSTAGATGAYTLTAATTVPSASNCDTWYIQRGVTTTQSANLSDCNFGPFYADAYALYADANAAIISTMSSIQVDSYQELYRFDPVSGIPSFVQSNNDLAAGSVDSRIFYTPSEPGYYLLLMGSFNPNITGTYTLSVQQTGAAVRAPLNIGGLGEVLSRNPQLQAALRAAEARGENRGQAFVNYVRGGRPWPIVPRR